MAALQRVIEIGLGIVLLIAGCVPAGFFISIPWMMITGDWDHPIWAEVLTVVAAGLLASWCVQTAWRLIAGRERTRGGLLSPTFLILVGAACALGAIAGLVLVGRRGLGGVVLLTSNALSLFGLARTRLRSKTGG